MHSIDQATQTIFADLNQRLMDAAFDVDFPENGSFTKSTVKGRAYWYYEGYDPVSGKKSRKYVGPVADASITSRVESFGQTKTALKARLETVRMLRAAGLPEPDGMTGAIVDRLARAGFFRLRGVLVGTIAFQTYPGLVGARADRFLQTGDVDLAQDHGISVAIEDTMEPALDQMTEIDPTFRPVPSMQGGGRTSVFVNAKGYRVEFLVPNRGSDDYQGDLTRMPALGGAAAQPLRFLDFLIRSPVRSVLLYGGGVSVTVPAPERYAVHKLIVATRRKDREKIAKDIGQSAFLIEALATFHALELTDAWIEAWQRGPKWQEALTRGKAMLAPDNAAILGDVVAKAAPRFDTSPADIGFA
jgi:hypothetical protein